MYIIYCMPTVVKIISHTQQYQEKQYPSTSKTYVQEKTRRKTRNFRFHTRLFLLYTVLFYSIFTQSQRDNNLILCLPNLRIGISRNNFVFKSSKSLWNALIANVFEKSIYTRKRWYYNRGSVMKSDF